MKFVTTYFFIFHHLYTVGLVKPVSRIQSAFFPSGWLFRHSSTIFDFSGLPCRALPLSSFIVSRVKRAIFKCVACFLPFLLFGGMTTFVCFSIHSRLAIVESSLLSALRAFNASFTSSLVKWLSSSSVRLSRCSKNE